MIDPCVAFGRPVLAHSGIPTAVIAERYTAGESIQELAEDYGRKPSEIEEAIRCELQIEAACRSGGPHQGLTNPFITRGSRSGAVMLIDP